eukprot:364820-Chlamydomonas_euryale.AAC.6
MRHITHPHTRYRHPGWCDMRADFLRELNAALTDAFIPGTPFPQPCAVLTGRDPLRHEACVDQCESTPSRLPTPQLDHQFHMKRKTGQIMRILDRGTSSIQDTVSIVLFNVLPQVRAALCACVRTGCEN